jgi:lysozyme
VRYMIDVYSGQGVIDWQRVAAAGFRLAYLKASEGATEKDAEFTANVHGCNTFGVTWGAYHFVTGAPSGNQWINCMDSLLRSELPPALDVEQVPGVMDSVIWLRAYDLAVNLVKAGRIPLIYTDRSMCDSLVKLRMQAKLLALCPLWLADYPTTPNEVAITPAPWSTYMFRQYSEHGEIAGIEGNSTDMNVTGPVGDRWLALCSP